MSDTLFHTNKISTIKVKNIEIGGDEFIVMAGPCSIESKEQLFEISKTVSKQGATVLRGGAFKPRTSPYDFQGLGEKGLIYLREAADRFNLCCISEVMSEDEVALVEDYVDILQVGSRNMHNYSLLKALGKTRKPILLKRGFSATYKEWLFAAEYIIKGGNPQVIFCERGIRTFEHYTRNTLDLSAIPVLRTFTSLPIIVDPSHGVGLRDIVPCMANAVIALRGNGLMVEVHNFPDRSLSDAKQTISLCAFSEMMKNLRPIGKAVNMRVRGGE